MLTKRKAIGEFTRRTTCRFCHRTNLVKILAFGNVPLAGGFLKEEDFHREKFYPLDLFFCEDCFLVQVGNVVSAEVLFQENYFFFSSAIRTLIDHFEEFSQEIMERFLKNIDQPSVLEIGCNDGILLRPLSSLGIRALGVDPATNIVKSLINAEEFSVINDFFSEELAYQIKKKYGLLMLSYQVIH